MANGRECTSVQQNQIDLHLSKAVWELYVRTFMIPQGKIDDNDQGESSHHEYLGSSIIDKHELNKKKKLQIRKFKVQEYVIDLTWRSVRKLHFPSFISYRVTSKYTGITVSSCLKEKMIRQGK